MVRLAVALLLVVAGVPGAASGAGALEFSGSIDVAGEVDVYRICAMAGESIALSMRGGPARLSLIDPSGATVPSFTRVWRAPRSGAYQIRVEGDPGAPAGSYVVSVSIDGRSDEGDPSNLILTQSQTPDPVLAGEALTYTIDLANGGPGVSDHANLLDPLPVGTTFVSATWTGPEENWECTFPHPGSNGKISCTNKCFEPDGAVTFTIYARVNACVGDRQLTNIVTASSRNVDAEPSDNVTAVTATVVDPRTCDDGSVCTVGDDCRAGTVLEENFDLVAPRTLPPGWTATLVVAPPTVTTGWRTGTGVVDTQPNSVFAPDAPDIRDMVLDSPPIRILTPNARVLFRNRYDLERNQDGGVLEMKIGNGPFVDIVQLGGHFTSGGYDGTIRLDLQSPIAGRNAWTGSSGGFVLTAAELPPAAIGQDIVLRWRLATDFAQGLVGQWIDSIVVTGPDVCGAGAAMSCDDGQACTVDSCDARDGCRHAMVFCDDGNDCTVDTCDAQTQCVHTVQSASCDDHDVCTQSDVCVQGTCVGTAPIACTAPDSCSSATCDEAAGCVTGTANFDTTGFSAGRVDGRDVVVLAATWGSCPGDLRYDEAANLDPESPCIDLPDFHQFMNVFGSACLP